MANVTIHSANGVYSYATIPLQDLPTFAGCNLPEACCVDQLADQKLSDQQLSSWQTRTLAESEASFCFAISPQGLPAFSSRNIPETSCVVQAAAGKEAAAIMPRHAPDRQAVVWICGHTFLLLKAPDLDC